MFSGKFDSNIFELQRWSRTLNVLLSYIFYILYILMYLLMYVSFGVVVSCNGCMLHYSILIQLFPIHLMLLFQICVKIKTNRNKIKNRNRKKRSNYLLDYFEYFRARLTHTLLQRTLYSKGTLCFSRA